jgi:hypothetical protein
MGIESQSNFKDQITGAWVQKFSGAISGEGVWSFHRDGSFDFRWKRTSLLVQGVLQSWRGEWGLSEEPSPRISVHPTSVTAPMQYAFDAAYLLNPTTAWIAGFRALNVGVVHAAQNKLWGKLLRFEGDARIGEEHMEIKFDGQSLPAVSYWKFMLLPPGSNHVVWRRV